MAMGHSHSFKDMVCPYTYKCENENCHHFEKHQFDKNCFNSDCSLQRKNGWAKRTCIPLADYEYNKELSDELFEI